MTSELRDDGKGSDSEAIRVSVLPSHGLPRKISLLDLLLCKILEGQAAPKKVSSEQSYRGGCRCACAVDERPVQSRGGKY